MLLARLVVQLALVLSLSGCGLYMPDMQPLDGPKELQAAEENIIVNQIKCELTKGVRSVLGDPFFATPRST